jgi:hypothetical protein
LFWSHALVPWGASGVAKLKTRPARAIPAVLPHAMATDRRRWMYREDETREAQEVHWTFHPQRPSSAIRLRRTRFFSTGNASPAGPSGDPNPIRAPLAQVCCGTCAMSDPGDTVCR